MSRSHVLFHLIVSVSVIYGYQFGMLPPPHQIKGKDVIKKSSTCVLIIYCINLHYSKGALFSDLMLKITRSTALKKL